MAEGTDGMWRFISGSERCPECGKEAVGEHRPSRWGRLRSWLIGVPIPSTSVCADGHEWSAAVYGAFRSRTYGFRRDRLPWSLVRVVLDHRQAMPTPIIYLLAVAVGVAVGTGLEFMVGWRWWLIASSVVGAVWLLYLSTALWGPYRVHFDDLVEAVDREKAQARRHRRLEEAIQEGSRDAYGVDGWAGPVALAGWSRVPSDGLTLDHGDRGDDLWVAVTTRTGDRMPEEVRRAHMFYQLVAEDRQHETDANSRGQEAWGRAIREVMPPWVPATMRVDGVVTPCESVTRGDLWAAVVEVNETTIEVVARGVDPASTPLRRRDSLEPYFEGLKRYQEPNGA